MGGYAVRDIPEAARGKPEGNIVNGRGDILYRHVLPMH